MNAFEIQTIINRTKGALGAAEAALRLSQKNVRTHRDKIHAQGIEDLKLHNAVWQTCQSAIEALRHVSDLSNCYMRWKLVPHFDDVAWDYDEPHPETRELLEPIVATAARQTRELVIKQQELEDEWVAAHLDDVADLEATVANDKDLVASLEHQLQEEITALEQSPDLLMPADKIADLTSAIMANAAIDGTKQSHFSVREDNSIVISFSAPVDSGTFFPQHRDEMYDENMLDDDVDAIYSDYAATIEKWFGEHGELADLTWDTETNVTDITRDEGGQCEGILDINVIITRKEV